MVRVPRELEEVMTSTDNTSKPLKTVDSIFNWQTQLLIREGIMQSVSDSKKINITQEMVDEAKAQAKADLYQLMLSLKPEEKEGVKEYRDSDGEAYLTCKTCGGYDECDCDGYNEALADWEAKLSEHFNGEGEV